MQGDCLSAVLFIFYLAKALECDKIEIYAENNGIFYIKPKYADDITVATINDNVIINGIEQEYPSRLAKYNLSTNVSKTEKYCVPEPEHKPESMPPNYENDKLYEVRKMPVVKFRLGSTWQTNLWENWKMKKKVNC